mmetsp:Transcript_99547/g.284582  ORF Transcript_99547/g.284582 Transcript_99547/m.284582 type:complete len:219 (+) Transcript_99547:158-814(+)
MICELPSPSRSTTAKGDIRAVGVDNVRLPVGASVLRLFDPNELRVWLAYILRLVAACSHYVKAPVVVHIEPFCVVIEVVLFVGRDRTLGKLGRLVRGCHKQVDSTVGLGGVSRNRNKEPPRLQNSRRAERRHGARNDWRGLVRPDRLGVERGDCRLVGGAGLELGEACHHEDSVIVGRRRERSDLVVCLGIEVCGLARRSQTPPTTRPSTVRVCIFVF